jgi:hypothetical protein
MDNPSPLTAMQASIEATADSFPNVDSLLEVDHLFICASGEAALSVLRDIGLRCPNYTVRRVDKGTASRLVLFENAYLELICIEDEQVAAQASRQTGIDMLGRSHWQHTRFSPFGVGLRCKVDAANLTTHSKRSRAKQIQRDPSIHFASDNRVNTAEPLCFVIPNYIALTQWLDRTSDAHQYLLAHPLGVKRLTDIKITIDSARDLTPTVSMLSHSNLVEIEQGTAPLLELVFDEEGQGQRLDLRPSLPVLLRY